MKKHGKKIAYLFVIFVLFGMCSPSFSFISTAGTVAQLAPNPNLLASSLPPITHAQYATPSAAPTALTCDSLFSFKITDCVLLGIYYVTVYPTYMLATLIATIFDWVTSVSITGSTYADNGFIKTGWAFMRNLANIVFIFGLLYIAARTILGMATAQTKKAVVFLILGALFVNFSLFFTRVVIDVSNLIGSQFYNAVNVTATNSNGQPKGLSAALVDKVSPQNLIKVEPDTNQSNYFFQYITVFIVQIITFLLLMYVFLLMCILMLVRIGMFWLLMVSAPLAFSIGLLPLKFSGPIKGISFENWSTQVISFSFIAPVLLFFLWLSAQLLSFDDLFPQGAYQGGVAGGFDAYFVALLGIFIKIGFLFTLLFLAQRTAKKMSGDAGAWAGKLAGSATGLAFGTLTAGYAAAGRGVLGAGNKIAGGRLTEAAQRAQKGNTLQRITGNAYLKANSRIQSSSFDWRNSPKIAGTLGKYTGQMTGQNLVQKSFGKPSGVGGIAKKQKDKEKKYNEIIDKELKTQPNERVTITNDVEKARTARDTQVAKETENVAKNNLDETKAKIRAKNEKIASEPQYLKHKEAVQKARKSSQDVTKAKEAVAEATRSGDTVAQAAAQKELDEKEALHKDAIKKMQKTKSNLTKLKQKEGFGPLVDKRKEQTLAYAEAQKKTKEAEEAEARAAEPFEEKISKEQADERVEKTGDKLKGAKEDLKKKVDQENESPEYKDAEKKVKEAESEVERLEKRYRDALTKKDPHAEAERAEEKIAELEKIKKDRQTAIDSLQTAKSEKEALHKKEIEDLEKSRAEKSKLHTDAVTTIKTEYANQKESHKADIKVLSNENEVLSTEIEKQKQKLKDEYGEIPSEADIDERLNNAKAAVDNYKVPERPLAYHEGTPEEEDKIYQDIQNRYQNAAKPDDLKEELKKAKTEIKDKILLGASDDDIRPAQQKFDELRNEVAKREADVAEKKKQLDDVTAFRTAMVEKGKLESEKARLEKIKKDLTPVIAGEQSKIAKDKESINQKQEAIRSNNLGIRGLETLIVQNDQELESKVAEIETNARNEDNSIANEIQTKTREHQESIAENSREIQKNVTENKKIEEDISKEEKKRAESLSQKGKADIVKEIGQEIKVAEKKAKENKEKKKSIEDRSGITAAKEVVKSREIEHEDAKAVQDKVVKQSKVQDKEALKQFAKNLRFSPFSAVNGNNAVAEQFEKIASGEQKKIKLT